MACIKHLLHIDAASQKVYSALSTIDELAQWWTTQTEGEPSVNGIITFRFGPDFMNQMKVIASEEGQRVEWECVDGPSDWLGTLIAFDLDEHLNKTRLRFRHSGWAADEDFFASCSFSWGRYLESLRRLCETGTGEAFGSAGYR